MSFLSAVALLIALEELAWIIKVNDFNSITNSNCDNMEASNIIFYYKNP